MKKRILSSLIMLTALIGINAQHYYQIQPSFISLSGGAGNISFQDVKFPGYHGRIEGAYFFNYLFGAGIQVDQGYYTPFPNKFADERVNTVRYSYNKTTADLSPYVVQNYTLNAYLVAMPDWYYSFMFSGGAGMQRVGTPKGSILYEEIYPFQFHGTPVQSSTVEFLKEIRTSFVFHAGARANLMFTDRFGMTLSTDYYYAKNKKYENERLHQFNATFGFIIKLHEMFD